METDGCVTVFEGEDRLLKMPLKIAGRLRKRAELRNGPSFRYLGTTPTGSACARAGFVSASRYAYTDYRSTAYCYFST